MDKRDAEGTLHGSDRSRELDGALLGAGGVRSYLQTILFGKCADESYGYRICAVPLTVFGASQALYAGAVDDLERILAPDDDGDGDDPGRRYRFYARGSEGSSFASRENSSGLKGKPWRYLRFGFCSWSRMSSIRVNRRQCLHLCRLPRS
jgi:hypothetical protein